MEHHYAILDRLPADVLRAMRAAPWQVRHTGLMPYVYADPEDRGPCCPLGLATMELGLGRKYSFPCTADLIELLERAGIDTGPEMADPEGVWAGPHPAAWYEADAFMRHNDTEGDVGGLLAAIDAALARKEEAAHA